MRQRKPQKNRDNPNHQKLRWGQFLTIAMLGNALYPNTGMANPVEPVKENEPREAIAIVEEVTSESAIWKRSPQATPGDRPETAIDPPRQLTTAEALRVNPLSAESFTWQEQPLAQDSSPPDPELETLRQQYLLEEPPTLVVPSAASGSAPGSSSGTPTAFGANWGRVYTGFGYQARTRYTEDSDGTLALGFGLGDSRETVGLEVNLVVSDLIDDTLGDGGVSLKVHRLLPNDFAVAAGVEYALSWGETDTTSSPYGVVTKVFRLKENTAEPFSRLTVSLGVGGGRYRSEDDVIDDNDTIGVFGSVSLRVAQPISLIADWTGQDLILGASIVPFKDLPVVITPAFADVTNTAGDGARFIMGIGYGYSFAY